jgi:hypothetical protein
MFSCRSHTPTDYAVVLVLPVFLFASLSWIFSARKWFTGPIKNVDETTSLDVEEKVGQEDKASDGAQVNIQSI